MDTTRKVMIFSDPIMIKDTVYTTFRNGGKWYDILEKGDEFTVGDLDTNSSLGKSKVIKKYYIRYRDAPDNLVAMGCYHDARTKDSLLNLLKNTYSDFNEDNMVTVVQFVYLG